MTQELVLAIDQGTSGTKALLLDRSGAVPARAAHRLERRYPHPGWVEQDAWDIVGSMRQAIDAVLCQVDRVQLAAVAISNQRESIVLWDRRTGEPLGPCISWQCRRTETFCADLRAAGKEEFVRARTGLPIDPLFSASKARWLLEQAPDGVARAANGELCLGTVDSWLLWNLTAGASHYCDLSNAARTQLFNIHELCWDPALLALFGISRETLPEAKQSGAVFGKTAATGALPGGIPIAALIGDSHAALFGQGGFRPGMIKATYGTGTSLMTPTVNPTTAVRGISTTIAWARAGVVYALEGNITVTGGAVAWLGRFLHLQDPETGVAALAASVPDSAGVYLVPAFAGLGAPHWDAAARGVIRGITDATTAAHLARATLDAIAFQVRDVFEAMRACTDAPFQVLLADGGASRNDMLMQLQADMLDLPVVRAASPDLSAMGAAYLAGLAVGFWSSEDEIAALLRPGDRFLPGPSAADRAARYAGWQNAVAGAMLHAPAE
jgi:glycerol kinase